MNTSMNGIKLSPAVRVGIGVIITALTALLTVLQDDAFTIEDAIIIGGAVLGYFGIVPPQVGGTQKGVVNPAVKDVPPSDNIEAGGNVR